MKKPKNTFIFTIFFCIALLFSVFLTFSVFQNTVDRNSYIVPINDKVTMNKTVLKKDERYKIQLNAMIQTHGEEALAVIEWGDGSFTRLGGDSALIVSEAYIDENLDTIHISFHLDAGRTWSNVVSFIGEKSYFKQSFDDIEAGVRGTVFDVDLDSDYIYVRDHEVELTKESGDTVKVGQDKPFSLEKFSFIDLRIFALRIKNAAWEDINAKLDTEIFSDYKAQLQSDISENSFINLILEIFFPKFKVLNELHRENPSYEKIQQVAASLDTEQKEELRQIITKKFQGFNFVTPDETELYNKKLIYKKTLLLLSNDADKTRLIETSSYDIKKLLQNKNIAALTDTLDIFSENSDILEKIDFNISEQFGIIPEDLQEIFSEKLGNLPQYLELFKDFDVTNITGSAEQGVQNFLDKNVDKKAVQESIQKITELFNK